MRAIEKFPNLVTMFFTRAKEKGDRPFLWRKTEGEWQPLSWADVARQVAALSAGDGDGHGARGHDAHIA